MYFDLKIAVSGYRFSVVGNVFLGSVLVLSVFQVFIHLYILYFHQLSSTGNEISGTATPKANRQAQILYGKEKGMD